MPRAVSRYAVGGKPADCRKGLRHASFPYTTARRHSASGVFDKFLNIFADSARHLDHAVLLRGSPSWGDDVLASLSCWNRTGPIWRAWFGMDAPNSELSDVPAFCWL